MSKYNTLESEQRFREVHPTYYRDAQRKWRAEHKEQERARVKIALQAYKDFVRAQKVGEVCCACSESNPDKLDFHHIDPATKKFTIGHTAARSQKSVLEEIAKCELRCHSCHTTHHNTRKPRTNGKFTR
jgi:protein-arginine kinase activator protein McsA